ncbi:2,3,4,5-tetrahydropyridine-2,6-dicarboxylate N-succinyltransferase [Parvularcula sp. ZS-1/3]|uniref:2,3,4,5-tetrahydropyridine-2,6-dicarboxylate N-succinyltransferase n=2 Tax=Parvularcula mediterranea TaxID=2732508 RepID=A0A7Y3RLZ9_9PROT|nr:2,3,4,5-tetrahydropyridine-2,6-dicarboxylate N-succinyltransferase [Parvularcula mediterranea]NNU15792.1 2,3,4,5-tetrahydropyridine-2,6-dicarboxylate N-succinyltransferase [Parvularcula mediterranea]
MNQARQLIDAGFDAASSVDEADLKSAVTHALKGLDDGSYRVASKGDDGQWTVHQWLKKAVLLSFRLTPNGTIPGGPGGGNWFDKVPSKFEGWDDAAFADAGFRAVPPAAVRRGSFVAKGAVLMPSYINIGAYVGERTMVDTWSTIGSCAQVGADCHISGGVGIGGVLEPLQAEPVIIEDNVFIGARSEVAEGVIVREGAVISMGVFLGASTKIVDRATGNVSYGEVPPYAVVVPGTLPGSSPEAPSLACAVIVKTVDERTRSKTGINEILRG